MEQEEHTATKKFYVLEALDQSHGHIFPIQGLALARQCIILTTKCFLLPCWCGHNKAIFKVAPLSLCIIPKQTHSICNECYFKIHVGPSGGKWALALASSFWKRACKDFLQAQRKCIMVMLCSLFCIIVLFRFEVFLLHTSSIWLKLWIFLIFFHRMN